MGKSVTFKNSELIPATNFLGGLKLTGKASRGQTKLIKLLAAKNEEYAEDRREALSPFFDGETLIAGREQEARKVATEVENEAAIITTTEYEDKLDALTDALGSYSDPFSGDDAILYDLILDALDTRKEDDK